MDAKNLPFINITKKPLRTTALCLISALLAAALFGGSIIVLSLRSGLESLQQRLGADVIVVPDEAAGEIEGILLQGTPGYFYMDRSVAERGGKTPGIEKKSSQYFLVSAKADCCTVKVQIIGFDDESDFTVKPWLSSAHKEKLGLYEIITGSGLTAKVGSKINLYGKSCKIVGKLEESGTGLDTAVYATNETVKELIKGSEEQGISVLAKQDPNDVVSSVYIKVKDDTDISDVVSRINQDIDGVRAVRTSTMITGTADKLSVMTSVISAMIAVVWLLAVMILLAAFSVSANERRREFAVLRLIGFSRKKLSRLLLSESLLVGALGGLCGVILSAALVLPFGKLIEQRSGLPMLIPDVPCILLLSLAALLSVLITGPLSAAASVYKLSRIDTAKILREVN